MDYFITVPAEILHIISSILDDRSKRQMRSTSTIWYNTINYDNFTVYFAQPSTLPDLIRTFSWYSKPIGLRFEKVISIDSSYIALASLTNLTRLEVNLPKMKSLPNIELSWNFPRTTNLQRFAIGSLVVPYSQHPNLTKLEVSAHYNLTNYFDGLYLLTQLEKFVWKVEHTNQQQTNVVSKFSNPALLKSIYIEDNSGNVTYDEESVSKMSSVSKVSVKCPEVLFPFSKLPNLESLRISSDRFDDFSACTKLTSLDVSICMGAARTARNDYFQQLTALYNLKSLSLRSMLKAAKLDSSVLVRLTDLENLTILLQNDDKETLECINSSKFTRVFIRHLKTAQSLSHLTNLQTIHIAKESKVNDHSIQLQHVTHLIACDLNTAPIFPNLKKFDGSNVILAKMSNLALLSHLESLSLGFISKETLHLIFKQTRLTELSVKLNDQHYDFEDLDQLTNLKKLSLSRWRKSTDMKAENIIWKAISNMTDLEELSMFHIDMKSVAILMKLPKLKQLFITGKTATQFDEANLSRLTNLQVLKLQGDSLTRAGAVHECKLQLPYLYSCHQ